MKRKGFNLPLYCNEIESSMKLLNIAGFLLILLFGVSCISEDKAERSKKEGVETLVEADKLKGKLFIIGGGKRPRELVRELIDISGIKNNSYAVILPMASIEPDSAIFYARQQFVELGIEAERITGFNFQNNRQNIEQLDSLAKAGLIYISGGDQNKFMDAVLDSPVSAAIKSAYRNGATIAGTSAGAAVMSKKMITGNEFKHPEYTGDFRTIEAENIEIAEGLGLLKNAIVDQHFIQRMRMNRLISTAIENPGELSIGIDESTAIIVENDSALVVGAAQVIVLKNTKNDKKTLNGLLGARDLKLSVVLPGERFAL